MNALLATHGRPLLLTETLRSLLCPENRKVLTRVVVVENGGDCGAREVVAGFDSDGRVVFLSIAMANKSAALNAGLNHCDEGLIFLTDDDVQVPPETIRRYSEASAKFGPGNYFGGETKPIYSIPPEKWLRPFLPASAAGWPDREVVDGGRWTCMGFNWAAYRQDLLAAGGFDLRFGPGGTTGATGQESEMQRKLWETVGAVGRFVQGAVVRHAVPPERCSPEWAIDRAYRHGVEKGITAARTDIEKAHASAEKKRCHGHLRRLIARFSFDETRRFRAAYWDSMDRGFKEGVVVTSGL